MALPEVCAVWIEQRVQEEMDGEKSLREIGRIVAAEVEKYFEAKVKPETIYHKARRMNEAGTNVPPNTTDENNKEIQKNKEISDKGFTATGEPRKRAPGAGRKPKHTPKPKPEPIHYEVTQTLEFGAICGTKEFTKSFEIFYSQVQIAKMEGWNQTPQKTAMQCVKMLSDLIEY